MGPEDLKEIIAALEPSRAEALLVGIEHSDDAGVLAIGPDLALVQTIDFITPIVDDPFVFGRIAAVNSLSDVYAMGGKPLSALNVCCFPPKGIGKEHLARILEGGLDAILEAGAILAGGHTIKDQELKYGLSVTGSVHPEKLLRNSGARPGDRLLLTKPLGTATLFSGLGGGALSLDDCAPAILGMSTLNRAAAAALAPFVEPGASSGGGAATRGVHALTDVTGFGLAGHSLEMARGADLVFELFASRLPAYPHALEMIDRDLLCGGSRGNRKAVEPHADFTNIAERDIWLACDAQTSGGLLIAVAEAECADLCSALETAGVATVTEVGRVGAESPGRLVIRS
jgi:selenide,water dikinase